MTAQVPDTCIYRGEAHSLCAFSDGEPFDPKAHGYRPVGTSTACYRGYICQYEVRKDQLFLRKLYINHQENNLPVSAKKAPPLLNGIIPRPAKNRFVGGWEFHDIGMPILYTGGLALGAAFVRAPLVHMRLHPAWKYERVHELVFEEGILDSATDLSTRMAEIRERVKDNTAPTQDADEQDVSKWVAETFGRNYR
jgi:hypothetical protein